jgi:hypothetical protein
VDCIAGQTAHIPPLLDVGLAAHKSKMQVAVSARALTFFVEQLSRKLARDPFPTVRPPVVELRH